MATNDMLQYLEPAASGGLASASNRQQVETFKSGGAIDAGDWVAFDATKTGPDRTLYVTEAAAVANGNPLVCGVALNTVAGADADVRVVIAGYASGASVANAVAAAGVALVVDNTAAGQAVAAVAGDLAPACGVSLAPAAGNRADVWVFKKF